MHAAKRFFYVSLGILALAGAFHLGVRSAQGQAVGVVAFGGLTNYPIYDAAGNPYSGWVILQNG